MGEGLAGLGPRGGKKYCQWQVGIIPLRSSLDVVPLFPC